MYERTGEQTVYLQTRDCLYDFIDLAVWIDQLGDVLYWDSKYKMKAFWKCMNYLKKDEADEHGWVYLGKARKRFNSPQVLITHDRFVKLLHEVCGQGKPDTVRHSRRRTILPPVKEEQ